MAKENYSGTWRNYPHFGPQAGLGLLLLVFTLSQRSGTLGNRSLTSSAPLWANFDEFHRKP